MAQLVRVRFIPDFDPETVVSRVIREAVREKIAFFEGRSRFKDFPQHVVERRRQRYLKGFMEEGLRREVRALRGEYTRLPEERLLRDLMFWREVDREDRVNAHSVEYLRDWENDIYDDGRAGEHPRSSDEELLKSGLETYEQHSIRKHLDALMRAFQKGGRESAFVEAHSRYPIQSESGDGPDGSEEESGLNVVKGRFYEDVRFTLPAE
jgi:hypothetical protein